MNLLRSPILASVSVELIHDVLTVLQEAIHGVAKKHVDIIENKLKEARDNAISSNVAPKDVKQ